MTQPSLFDYRPRNRTRRLPRVSRLIVRNRIVFARHVRGERAVATLRRVGREWAWTPCAWMPDGFGPSRETFPTERDALGDVGIQLKGTI